MHLHWQLCSKARPIPDGIQFRAHLSQLCDICSHLEFPFLKTQKKEEEEEFLFVNSNTRFMVSKSRTPEACLFLFFIGIVPMYA